MNSVSLKTAFTGHYSSH